MNRFCSQSKRRIYYLSAFFYFTLISCRYLQYYSVNRAALQSVSYSERCLGYKPCTSVRWATSEPHISCKTIFYNLTFLQIYSFTKILSRFKTVKNCFPCTLNDLRFHHFKLNFSIKFKFNDDAYKKCSAFLLDETQ